MSTIVNFSTAGDLTVGGTLTVGALVIGTLYVDNIEPNADNTYTLGTPTARWANIYAVDATVSGTLNVGTLVVGTLETENIAPAVDNTYTLGTTLLRWASVYAVALNGTLQTPAQPNITSVGTLTGLTVAGNIVPSANNTYNLGSSLLQWANIYCANFTPAGNVVPSADDLYNLGSMALRWATTYSANVVATNLTGTLQTAAQPNITSVGTLTGLTVAGNIVPSTTGIYNLGSPSLQWANLYCSNFTPTGNIIPSADDSYSLGASLFRWATTYSVNVIATNLIGALQTAAQPNVTSVGTLTGLTVAGNILPGGDNADNLGSTLLRWATTYSVNVVATNLGGTLTTAAQPNVTSVGILAGLTTSADIVPDTDGTLNLGASLYMWSNVYTQTVTASYLNGTLLTGVQLNITTVGTLTQLTVANSILPGGDNVYNLGSPTARWANIYCAAVTPTGSIVPNADNSYNLGSMTYRWATTYSVNVTATNLAGTLTTAAQPNITSVGTLSGLTVSASILPSITNSDNLGSGALVWATVYATAINATNLTGTLQTAAQPNITSVGTLSGLTVSASILPSITNSDNLGSGALVWATVYATAINATNLTGTLQTAAQPNITSVGTLSGLTVSASILPSITNTDNLGSGTLLWATVYATTITATNLAGTLTTAAQTNITSVGTLSALTVSGTVTLSGLTASEAVVTNASKQLASLAYGTAATASNLAQRDTNGLLAFTNNLLAYSNGALGSNVSNTTTPTTVTPSITIPAGTISSAGGGGIVFVLTANVEQNISGSLTFSLIFNGSTTALTLVLAAGASSPCRFTTFYIVVYGTGTNTQGVAGSAAATDGTATSPYVVSATGTATLTTTSANTAQFGVFWNTSSASLVFRLYSIIVYQTLYVVPITLP